MKELLRAWAGGLFDGEGSIFLAQVEDFKYFTLTSSLAMTDKATVARFRHIVGTGEVKPAPQRNPNAKPQVRWRTFNVGVIFVLEQLKPYIFTKLPQARLAYRFMQECFVGKGQQRTEDRRSLACQLFYELAELNKRGTQ